MEHPFVTIETFFETENERTLEALEKVYDNRERLSSTIRKVVGNDFFTSVSGKKILIKPNWVMEDTRKEHQFCLRTNDKLLLAFLEELLSRHPVSVIIADAPVQGAVWDRVVTTNLKNEIESLSTQYDIPIEIKDLRRKIMMQRGTSVLNNLHPLSEYIVIDVKDSSILEPISTAKKAFRVLGYDYRKTNSVQYRGVHKYCISKEMFDADIIISMPKVKTHQKTGITCALKNLVGLNGDKDYLPHHRLGGTGFGGDCYPGRNLLRFANERIIDLVNRKQDSIIAIMLRLLARLCWELSIPGQLDNRGAAWYGNDTCWRMVMDLNLVAIYGKADGTISDIPQRQIYSLCDGIVGGQGNGPLNPEPLALGILSFTNSSALNDACMTQLMGFDMKKLPVVDFSFEKIKDLNCEILLNGECVQNLRSLSSFAIYTKAAPGWNDYLNEMKK